MKKYAAERYEIKIVTSRDSFQKPEEITGTYLTSHTIRKCRKKHAQTKTEPDR